MDRKTIEDLERDVRDKLVIDIRSKEDFDKETYLEMRSKRHWGTKAESNDLEAVSFRWMRHLFCVR